MTINLQGHASDFGNILAAISALGTAAFGLVDATKVYRGGVSNIGFGFVKNAVTPYVAALRLVSAADPFATIKANWLNGVAKADQKATVKSLIRLGLTTATVGSLAAGAPGVDAAALQTAAAKVDAGTPLGEQDISALGDPIADLFDFDHKFFEQALGYTGPIAPIGATAPPWQIPDDSNYNHGDYLPPSDPTAAFPDANGKWVETAGFMKRAFAGAPQTWP